MGFLWHFPSEGPLSRPFTNYTHNTSYRPNARGGPSSYFSQSLELCVATSKYFMSPVIDYPGQRYSSLSWSALCFCSGTQLPDNSRSCQLLGLCLFIIRRPAYPDAPYRKFLGLCYLTTRVPGRRDLDTQTLGRTRNSWSAFICYVNADYTDVHVTVNR